MSNRESLIQYAIEQSKALIKHSTDEELKYFINLLETEKNRIIQNRPAQSLNDASYHIYCKFFLGGK